MTLRLMLHGAFAGLVSAAATDLHAFRVWKSFNDARTYDWGTALFRWMQGIIIGALTAIGLGGLGL